MFVFFVEFCLHAFHNGVVCAALEGDYALCKVVETETCVDGYCYVAFTCVENGFDDGGSVEYRRLNEDFCFGVFEGYMLDDLCCWGYRRARRRFGGCAGHDVQVYSAEDG